MEIIFEISIVLCLILLSGLFSGLTIGLVGLSKTEIMRASDLGDTNAKKVLAVKQDANLLLVTLLLGNTAVNSTLAIFLGSLVGAGITAGIVSTLLIMIFGEILPASFISRNPLQVGGVLAPFVKALLFICYPITKPISSLLDKWVGVEGLVIFSKRELKHIIELASEADDGDLDEIDIKTLKGAVSLSEKTVEEHMSDNIFFLNSGDIIDFDLIENLKNKGYTRIPVFSSGEVIGILNAKRLLNIDTKANISVNEVMNKSNVCFTKPELKLDDLLDILIQNHFHIAIVKDPHNIVIGIITLEDILEELLMTEIEDGFHMDDN